MDDCLNFPPARLPSIIPSTTDMLVKLQNDPEPMPFIITNPLLPDQVPDNDKG